MKRARYLRISRDGMYAQRVYEGVCSVSSTLCYQARHAKGSLWPNKLGRTKVGRDSAWKQSGICREIRGGRVVAMWKLAFWL